MVATLAFSDVQSLLLGDEGTTAQVTLRRQSAERTLSIVRRRVVWPSVAVSSMLAGRIGYLKLYGFPEAANANEIRAALVGLLGAHPRALIVDLRENHGGGGPREPLDTMSLFLPSDTKVAERLARNGLTSLSTTGDPIVPAIPMVALIGPGTFSAGELMAAALKERRGATLVGTRTAGQLEAPAGVRLSDGSVLRVAVAQVRTANGVEIEGRGYPADVEVSPAASGDQDFQLQRAIHVIIERLSLKGIS